MPAAPTGRAAGRLAELTGQPAVTVHRLLKLQPGGDAGYDRDNPLDVDLLVVDEASMLDLILANKLEAVPPGAPLLLVGDVDHLPSVGAGEVLRDLLAADPSPRVRLTQVFRQAADSGVITNAHRINAGRPPLLQGMRDIFLFASDDTEATAALTVEVAAPASRRSSASTRAVTCRSSPRCTAAQPAPERLNTLLQQHLTLARDGLPERRASGHVFRVGALVSQAVIAASSIEA